MTTKRILQPLLIIAIVLGALALPTMAARAWTGSCGDYITAQAGDTIESIASTCGTSAAAIRAANPGVGSQLSAGQVLYVPGGTSGSPLILTYVTQTYVPITGGNNTYIVQPGDTLGNIAFRFGVSLSTVLALNPWIMNPSLIYPGQVIYLPGSVPVTSTPAPYSGFARLTVTFNHGLLVRTGPGKNYPEIVSPLVGALKNEQFLYRRNSMTTDSTGLVWVEIRINPASGYSTGWIMTRDAVGQYYTRPNIGPAISPGDP